MTEAGPSAPPEPVPVDPTRTPGGVPPVPPPPPPMSGPSMVWQVFESVVRTLGIIGIIILIIIAILLFPFVILFFCGMICWAGLCVAVILGPIILVFMGYEFYKGQRRDEYRSQLLQHGYTPEQVERIIQEKGL